MRKLLSVPAVALAAVLVTTMAPTMPAAADGSGAAATRSVSGTPARAHDRTAEILAPCIAEARRVDADAWTCTAAGLMTVTVGADGKRREAFTPVKSRTVAPERSTAARDDRSTTLQDDYDSWCEGSGICHRNPFGNKFLEETKGNAAYGSGPNITGTFDIIIRSNLNGRQAQWRETFIWDSGPGVSFEAVFANCWEAIDFWPDLNCGNHYGGSRRIGPGAARWDTPTLFGNRLVNSADYYGMVTGLFTTDEDPVRLRAIVPLETTRFQCPGTSNCVFY